MISSQPGGKGSARSRCRRRRLKRLNMTCSPARVYRFIVISGMIMANPLQETDESQEVNHGSVRKRYFHQTSILGELAIRPPEAGGIVPLRAAWQDEGL